MANPRADELREILQLQPHPEGGWYREIFRSAARVAPQDGRAPRDALTVIYFLLAAGEHSAWHVVLSDECWQFCEGDPLELVTFDPASRRQDRIEIGPVAPSRRPVHVVPAGIWQAARTTGEYTLVQCTVGPGFDFEDFRLNRDSVDDLQTIQRALAEWAHFL